MTQTDYLVGQWIGWNGGECPVHPKSLVEVISWAGCKRNCSAGLIRSWNDDGAQSQPVAFRIVTPYVEPAPKLECWVKFEGGFIADATLDGTDAEKYGYTRMVEANG